MSSVMDNVQPAVKKETQRVAAITGIGLILMWIIFGVMHGFMPQKVPLDYTVFLGGAVGGCVAVLNFFFMGLAVQKAAPDAVGGRCNRCTMFPFCSRNRSAFISWNRN